MSKNFITFPSELVEEVTYDYNDLCDLLGYQSPCSRLNDVRSLYFDRLFETYNLELSHDTEGGLHNPLIFIDLYKKFDSDVMENYYF